MSRDRTPSDPEPRKKPKRNYMVSKDLRRITRNWPYTPGEISVRKFKARDGRVKIQMRVDMGVLQMETVGRPDGQRPHDRESLLHHHQERLEEFRRRNGTDLGFSLTAEECRYLRDESLQYYQRYLAHFALEEYGPVVQDTRRNLEVLDLCVQYAEHEEDRYALEQYRPYILMMHGRSLALLAMEQSAYRSALAHVNHALKQIRDFFRKYGQPKAFRISGEVHVLKALRQEIRRHLPVDPVRRLKRKLDRAVAEERYEDAAKLRDQLNALHDPPAPQG